MKIRSISGQCNICHWLNMIKVLLLMVLYKIRIQLCYCPSMIRLDLGLDTVLST